MIRVAAQQGEDGTVLVGFMDPLEKPPFTWITLTREEADELVQEVQRILSLL